MPEMRLIKAPKPHNFFYFVFGLAVLALNKVRHSVRGYRTPRTFPVTEFKRAIEYDMSVVDHWLNIIEEYTHAKLDLAGKTVLELGPGADLGVGLILLARGARKYNAIDVNNLVGNVPEQFYDELFEYVRNPGRYGEETIGELRAQLKSTQAGKNDRLNYLCQEDFDISILAKENIDLVFSQAAFEHFDDIDTTLFRLNNVVRNGAILVAEIDLNTHTRWLRDVDPLNIYRFPDFIYNLCRFSGSPNRFRPNDYKQALERHGWGEVTIWPLTRVDDDYASRVKPTLPAKFRHKSSQIEWLSVMVCARKKS